MSWLSTLFIPAAILYLLVLLALFAYGLNFYYLAYHAWRQRHALVWLPGVIILFMGGHYGTAIGLLAFCILVVGGIDNFLRPRLVGKDTSMHELSILFGTLGGIIMFGVAGIIIGPIVAALAVTVWEIYGVAFQDELPDRVEPASGDPERKDSRILLAADDSETKKS